MNIEFWFNDIEFHAYSKTFFCPEAVYRFSSHRNKAAGPYRLTHCGHDAYIHYWIVQTSVQVIASCLFGAVPFSSTGPNVNLLWIEPLRTIYVEIKLKQYFDCIYLKMSLAKWLPFQSGLGMLTQVLVRDPKYVIAIPAYRWLSARLQ